MALIYDFDFGPSGAGLEATVTDLYTAVEVDESPLTLDSAGRGQLTLAEGSYRAEVDGERHIVINGVLSVEDSLDSGGELFSMAARTWTGIPFSGEADEVGGTVDAGPEFGWSLSQFQDGTWSGENEQYQVLTFDQAGIYSVALSVSVNTPTTTPDPSPGENFAKVSIYADTGVSVSGYSQSQQAVAAFQSDMVDNVGTTLTFAAAQGDAFILRIQSNLGGLVSGSATYLTIVKLAPYA